MHRERTFARGRWHEAPRPVADQVTALRCDESFARHVVMRGVVIEQQRCKADERERGVGVQILLDLGVRRARILTNNPQKLVPLYGLEVVERIPIEVPPRATNRGYLTTKRNKLGHLLTVIEGES